jgi:hypothetical protein
MMKLYVRLGKSILGNILVLLTLTVALSVLFSTIVTAQINNEGGFYSNHVEFFDPNAGPASGSGFCGSNGVVLTGSDNHERAFTFLVQKGLTEYQAAGVVGNLIYESNVDPTRVEIKRGEAPGYRTFSDVSEITSGRGYGIAQWTSASRQEAWINFANERGLPVTDLGLQLEFLWHELNTNSQNGYAELQESEDVRQAAWIFLSFFERPGSVIEAGKVRDPVQPTSGGAHTVLNERHGYASTVLEQFGGVDPGLLDSSCNLDVGGPDFSANGVRVDGGRPWIGEAGCTGSFTAGAQALSDFVMQTWSPPVTKVEGYNCRQNTADASETSIHGLGRALDIMVNANTPEGLATGDQIRNWMINNSVAIGVQRVIWNRYTWASNRDGWRPYGGPNPHTDHLHVEVNEDGANMITPWFQQQPGATP